MRISRIYLLSFILFFSCVRSYSQNGEEKTRLSLVNVIHLAINQSSSVKYVQNRDVNYYWRWRNFKTTFMPRLVLSGNLPDLRHTTTPVTQPDGSIEFKNISQLSASSTLALSQYIPQTGTSIYAATSFFNWIFTTYFCI